MGSVKVFRLILCFRVLVPGSGDQHPDERGEERLTSTASIVDELEEAQIDWKLLLGYASVRPQPRA